MTKISSGIGLAQLNWRTSLSAYINMVKKEFIIMMRYPIAFVTSFVQIFFILATFSLGATMFAGTEQARGQISGAMIYGFILFLFTSDALWTIGFSLRREQMAGTLESIYLTPANQFANLVSRISVIVVWTGLISICSVILSSFIFGKVPIHNVFGGLLILIFALSGTFGLGFMLAGLGIRMKETMNLIINLGQFIILILCAMFFPFSVLPEPILWISKIIPLSYAVDLFRSVMIGFPSGYPELASFQVEVVIVVLFGLLFPLLGYKYYQRQIFRAQGEGSLSNF